MWYKGDGDADKSIGQTTIIENLSNICPYLYSMLLLYFTFQYLEQDSSIVLGGYRASDHQHKSVTKSKSPIVGSTQWS